MPKDLASGEVDVVDASRRFVARGLFDRESPLAVRIWTLDQSERIDAALVARRVAVAAAYRAEVIDRDKTDSFRLCNGEGDRLPGLVCDVYGHTAVIKIDSSAVLPLVGPAAEAVKSVEPQLRRILLRRTTRSGRKRGRSTAAPGRRGEGPSDAADDSPRDELQALLGSLPDAPVRMREHGVTCEVDVRRGHKTGAYLDQRENRQLVRSLARGKRVLDVFSYTGGFALAAALGGAVSIRCIDVSRHALDAAKRNFALNGLDPDAESLAFTAADAFQALGEDRATYDLAILDPPSMAQSASTLESGLAAYRRLNSLVIGRLVPGGLLFTASCSSHVTEQQFLGTIRDAAVDAGRTVRVLAARGAGPDHPTLPAFPEGRYLSAFLVGAD